MGRLLLKKKVEGKKKERARKMIEKSRHRILRGKRKKKNEGNRKTYH
jgi:hypothetical protein